MPIERTPQGIDFTLRNSPGKEKEKEKRNCDVEEVVIDQETLDIIGIDNLYEAIDHTMTTFGRLKLHKDYLFQ